MGNTVSIMFSAGRSHSVVRAQPYVLRRIPAGFLCVWARTTMGINITLLKMTGNPAHYRGRRMIT